MVVVRSASVVDEDCGRVSEVVVRPSVVEVVAFAVVVVASCVSVVGAEVFDVSDAVVVLDEADAASVDEVGSVVDEVVSPDIEPTSVITRRASLELSSLILDPVPLEPNDRTSPSAPEVVISPSESEPCSTG